MKALSLRQPWAWAVVFAGKTIENRRWSTPFRGEFFIHAAKGMTRDEYEGALDFVRDLGLDLPSHGSPEFVRGGIVGRARIVDVIPPCSDGSLFSAFECKHRWHMPEQYGFVLEDVRLTPFVPCRGMLGFFDVPADVSAAVQGAA